MSEFSRIWRWAGQVRPGGAAISTLLTGLLQKYGRAAKLSLMSTAETKRALPRVSAVVLPAREPVVSPASSRSDIPRFLELILRQQVEPARRQQGDPIRNQPQDVVVIVRANRHVRRIIDRVRLAAPLEPANFWRMGFSHGIALKDSDGH